MSIGKFSEFKVGTDNWQMYIERLEQYFIVNNIASKLHVPTLITVIGTECYELLVDLCTPDNPTKKSFQELTDILKKYLQPIPSVLAERYKFKQRKQNDGESLAEYVAALKKLSRTCGYGGWLQESLRDQFVCGISNETIRQRLFAEGTLEFSRAYTIAISMETAIKDAAVVERTVDKVLLDCQSMSSNRQYMYRGVKQSRPSSTINKCERRDEDSSCKASATRTRFQVDRSGSVDCGACGGEHDMAKCRFTRYVCRVCNRRGHLRRMCPNLRGHHAIDATEMNTEVIASDSIVSDEVIIYDMNQLSASQFGPIYIKLNINNYDFEMELDTGSAVSCINQNIHKKYFNNLELRKTNVILRYYSGETVRPLGVIRPLIKYKDRHKHLDLFVIQNGKTMLLGRQWIVELNIQIPNINNVNNVDSSKQAFNLDEFSSRYCNVFADGLGRFTGCKVSIHLRDGARPVFMRARPLAYALREPVERALDQLVHDGVLTPVNHSDWATPIVPVVKKDGSIRVCADYKLTLNKVLEVDRYPLPRVEDLLVRLNGGVHFSKIDLSQAYAQLELDESRKYTVVNTHKGLFMYNRLVYGLSSSPGIFQRLLEQLFANIKNVGVFLDDIIITGRDMSEHIRSLHEVFKILDANGLRVNKGKCEFFKESVTYLGHVISKNGVHTCPEKVKAISNTPAPQNVSELRAFIGMVMYYGKFIKNVSTILSPLYNLLKKNVKFVWSDDCENAFKTIKTLLSSCQVLAYYAPELPLILTVDASSVGVGAVLSQVTPDGERPVAYASRSLNAAERGYAQIDREALAIVYGVRKYHQYLYGRKFVLKTDHKPLTYIFGQKVGIPVMAASRLQRWAVLLSGYNYDIQYVASSKNCADALSRLPQRMVDCGETTEVSYVNFVENFLPVTHDDVRRCTAQDKTLCRLMFYLQSGWSNYSSDEEIKPYHSRRNELYVERGCIMWGYRMVLPLSLRKVVLQQLHTGHMGIVKTKSLARSYVWWPNIDNDIEMLCKSCEVCAAEAFSPPRTQPKPWPYITQPWSRLHIDFLGPLKGKTYLVLVDSSSKWLEVFEMARTNAYAVIKELRATFARFGLPKEVVSDQGPPFASQEFKNFLKNNGIRQSFSPTYHPSSNGAAENAVKNVKQTIKKAYRERLDVDVALQSYLLAYRNSVHSTTGETPAMLLQRRAIRSRLDLLRSDQALEQKVLEAQQRQIDNAGGVVAQQYKEGDKVWFRQYRGNDNWAKGSIVNNRGTRRYVIKNENGEPIEKHTDQIKPRPCLSELICPRNLSDHDQGRVNCEEEFGERPVVHEGDEGGIYQDSTINMPEVSLARNESSPLEPNRPKRTLKPIVRYPD